MKRDYICLQIMDIGRQDGMGRDGIRPHKAWPHDDVVVRVLNVREYQSFKDMPHMAGLHACLPDCRSLEAGLVICVSTPGYKERAARHTCADHPRGGLNSAVHFLIASIRSSSGMNRICDSVYIIYFTEGLHLAVKCQLEPKV